MTQKQTKASNTLKFLYSYGGKIVPRPTDGVLRYNGGVTRVLAVDRSVSYADLLVKFVESCGSSMILKCKLPTEDLDVLVTIKSDEELRLVIGEYERVSPDSKIRALLFPQKSVKNITPPSSPVSFFDHPSISKYYVSAAKESLIQNPLPPPRGVHRYAPPVAAAKLSVKKITQPSSPVSCFDFPSMSKPYAPAPHYHRAPPRAAERRYNSPVIGYPVAAGRNHCHDTRNSRHLYNAAHMIYTN